jgi:hypothetical protein
MSRSARRRFIQRPNVRGSFIGSGNARLLGRSTTGTRGACAFCQRFWPGYCSMCPSSSLAPTSEAAYTGVPSQHRSPNIHRQIHP